MATKDQQVYIQNKYHVVVSVLREAIRFRETYYSNHMIPDHKL